MTQPESEKFAPSGLPEKPSSPPEDKRCMVLVRNIGNDWMPWTEELLSHGEAKALVESIQAEGYEREIRVVGVLMFTPAVTRPFAAPAPPEKQTGIVEFLRVNRMMPLTLIPEDTAVRPRSMSYVKPSELLRRYELMAADNEKLRDEIDRLTAPPATPSAPPPLDAERLVKILNAECDHHLKVLAAQGPTPTWDFPEAELAGRTETIIQFRELAKALPPLLTTHSRIAQLQSELEASEERRRDARTLAHKNWQSYCAAEGRFVTLQAERDEARKLFEQCEFQRAKLAAKFLGDATATLP